MSDTKKPKLSEIRAEAYLSPVHVPYLLDLVKRLEKWVAKSSTENCACLFCQEARALLKELEK